MTAEETGKSITNILFFTSCEHADDGYCNRCIKDYLPEMIAAKIRDAEEQAYEKGFCEARERAEKEIGRHLMLTDPPFSGQNKREYERQINAFHYLLECIRSLTPTATEGKK